MEESNTNQRKEGVKYVATEGKQETQENIQAEKGYYDEFGFYILVNEEGKDRGDFYDPNGFYFDLEGYDEFGGYYDDDLNYVPGEEYKAEYYARLKQIEDKERQKLVVETAQVLELIQNHIHPAIEYVK
jgi:hypothetical protein